MNNIFKYVFFYFLLITLAGCSCYRHECYSESNKELKLRWGYFISKTGLINGYQLNNDATLQKFSQFGGKNNFSDSVLTIIEGEKYCRLLGMTRDTILRIQALNEPGDSLHFIEYSDPPRNVRMRAVWNPINKTYGSRGFRGIYDSLQTLVHFVQ